MRINFVLWEIAPFIGWRPPTLAENLVVFIWRISRSWSVVSKAPCTSTSFEPTRGKSDQPLLFLTNKRLHGTHWKDNSRRLTSMYVLCMLKPSIFLGINHKSCVLTISTRCPLITDSFVTDLWIWREGRSTNQSSIMFIYSVWGVPLCTIC